MSLTYNKYPVYIGGSYANTEEKRYVPATQAVVNLNTTQSPKRKLGIDIETGDQFGIGGGLTADITIDCLFQSGMVSGLEEFITTANQENYTTIRLGGNTYEKCYATDVSISIEPFTPVTLQAKFVSLDPDTGAQILGDDSPYGGGVVPLDSDLIAYGHTCAIVDNPQILNSTQSQITFNRRYDRSPVYSLGSVNATKMLLDGIEEEMTISSTGVNELINFSGDILTAQLDVDIKCFGGSDPILDDLISFVQGSRVSTQSVTSNGGDAIVTTSTIRQVKL